MSKGPSAEDAAFATRAPAHVRKLIEQDLTRACVMRCEARGSLGGLWENMDRMGSASQFLL